MKPQTLTDDLLAFLDQREIKGRIDLVGWSMGANLALDFARAYPAKVSALYLLSMRQQWPPAEIEAIRAELVANPRDFLISFYRKCFLGYKQEYSRFMEELQDQYLQNIDIEVLLDGLDYLKRYEIMPAPGCETHCIHGRKDIVAPVHEMAHVPGAISTILEHAGHAVFFDRNFNLPEKQRKKAIRQRFSKAAETYDSHAGVQKELAQRLADDLRQDAAIKTVLEVGCGTGNYTAMLAAKFPHAQIVGVDFSLPMLVVAQRKLQSLPGVTLICEDGENFLAGTGYGFDLITANSTMQWFDNINAAFAHIKKLLKKGGIFWGTIFGPKTLQELGEGLEQMFGEDIHLPSIRFLPKEELLAILKRHFARVEMSEWQKVREYPSLRDLLAHIRKTGTGGWQPLPPVLTRGRLQKLDDWFIKQYGGFRLTYQAFFIRCQ